VTAERSRRFALTGQDPEGRNRTIILWREVDLVDGTVVRRVVVTLDATMTTATMLTCAQAVEVAQAMLAAARSPKAATTEAADDAEAHPDRRTQ
jgi:hypothetical protein